MAVNAGGELGKVVGLGVGVYPATIVGMTEASAVRNGMGVWVAVRVGVCGVKVGLGVMVGVTVMVGESVRVGVGGVPMTGVVLVGVGVSVGVGVEVGGVVVAVGVAVDCPASNTVKVQS